MTLTVRQCARSIAAVALAALPFSAAMADDFRVGLPVTCEIDKTCFLQNFFDTDPGPGASDFTCGAATYDGHKGTDIRVFNLADIADDYPVVAAAAGTVKGVRDGMLDRILTEENKAEISDRECGNGVVIDHGNGWETQYCHMRRGSVEVRPGETVEAGAVLGMIGNSGFAAFPHAHLSVRKDGVPIDPFTGHAAAGGSCGTGTGESLWTAEAAAVLHGPKTEAIRVGFASAPVTPDSLVATNKWPKPPAADWPAIVVYAYAINLKPGDVQTISFTTPDGRTAENTLKPLERAKATQVPFAGRRRPDTGWQSGTYGGRYTVVRDGQTIVDVSISEALNGS